MPDPALAELSAAVDGLALPVDGGVLAGVLAVRDRLEAKVVEAVSAFDEASLWDTEEGAASMTAWLRICGGLSNRDAARLARTARRLRSLPVLGRAWSSGEISGGVVQVVCANVTDRTTSTFAAQEAELVPILARLSVADATVVMRQWAARAKEALEGDDDGPDEQRRAHLSPLLDGCGRLDATLDRDGFQVARAAMRLALGARVEGDERTPAQRRHDALVTVFAFFLDHQMTRRGGHHRPHLNLTIPLAALLAARGQGTFDDGAPLTAGDARRLACDAAVHRVITRGDGSILDYGRATRVVSAALFTVIALRDQRCRFPGCDRHATLTQAHHIHHWTNGGPTRPDNLVLLCWHHHRVIHRPGWTLKLQPDATVIVTAPDNRRRTSRPPDTHGLAA